MKNHPIPNWAALLLMISGMAASPLSAATKVVNTDQSDITDTDGVYEAVSGTAALYVYSPGASYSGSNITLSSTLSGDNSRFGAYINNGASVSLAGGTITTTNTAGISIYLNGTSSGTVRDLNVTTAGDGTIRSVFVNNSSTLFLSSSTLAINGSGYGIYIGGTSSAILDNIQITVVDGPIISVLVTNAQVTLTDVDITITSGSEAAGLGIDNTAVLTATNVRIAVSSGGAHNDGVRLGGHSAGTMTLTNADITVDSPDSQVIYLASSSTIGAEEQHTLVINGGRFSASQGTVIAVNPQSRDNYDLDLYSTYQGNYEITLRYVTMSGTSALEITSIRSGTWSDGTVGSVDMPTNFTLHTERATISGDANFYGSATSTLNLADSSTLTGNVSGNNHAVIDLTVSGSNSALLGDIAQNDEAVITVTISDGATGSGGFANGNLITDSDSAWNFNKDSHGNYGENDGVWSIGDYDVTFDNLTHTGTVNLSVNSDTGEGGSIRVTDTADGEGTVHIDTTGNGKADPNQVLPGIVSGDGTEHWQWDPIDWGIDTIIKDGDHFIKQGTSPAGAVLNSSVAIQQAMWFAQQNSLLKRMGELRYGARASSPRAGGTPPVHKQIDNIWLRSYGQQLNVGSKVAGKAYEQLIYGVDLGTDHKFTLSADSDLYLGVYAGYGRSDIDYRTPAADGELNSYYGGLYATWLHSSGLYIDATVKAASVDNNLKAPYGTTQLTANYSDVNIGGSLEIGNKFTFTDDWFIEPQFQVNYLHILAEDYTAGPMSITTSDLDALQLRLGSLFGRTIKLTNGGALQPYIKVSGVETISTGGTLRNGYQHIRANTDGARAEIGGGIIWQLDADNQLHLDYEASFGDKYDKPWGLTAGYRHQF
ncbi:MAG: autotransporter outer membrane beta-barrel domain-containing protein [Verrucomicrobiales bacterium]|nr:autotransporter outer membrane beta-barrel domain-containing protein [Verrucomicrobiales bacterium]